jgi:hypothetical protein
LTAAAHWFHDACAAQSSRRSLHHLLLLLLLIIVVVVVRDQALWTLNHEGSATIAQPMPQQLVPFCTSLQDGCTASLEGVTFTGRTDLAASKDAPAISMAMPHLALCAVQDATARLKGGLTGLSYTGTQDIKNSQAGVSDPKGHLGWGTHRVCPANEGGWPGQLHRYG